MGLSAATVQAGVKSVQRGQIYAIGGAGGTAPEMRYIDITISAVTTSKARVIIEAVMASRTLQNDADNVARTADIAYGTVNEYGRVFGYLLNSTTIRIYGGMSNTFTRWSGRWEVVEDF